MKYVLTLIFSTLIAFAQQPPPRMAGVLEVDPLTQAPLQIIQAATLDASPEKVFAFIDDYATLPKWVVGVQSVKVDKDQNRMITGRMVTLADGSTATERMIANQQTQVIAYAIQPGNPFGLTDHLGVFSFQPAGQKTRFTWWQYYNHTNAAQVSQAINGVMQGSIQNLIERFGGQTHSQATGAESISVRFMLPVDTSVDKAWKILADGFGDIDQWSSLITHADLHQASDGSMIGAQRSCNTMIGNFKEKILTFDEKERTFSYQAIEGMPPIVTKAVNAWRIEKVSRRKTVVHVNLTLDMAQGVPASAIGMIKGSYYQVLDMTLEELAVYLKTGKPHPRVAAGR